MNEIWNSLVTWFKEKTASPLYGTFIVSVVLWNWKFFYVLFWQDESSLGSPRLLFVEQHYLNQQYFGIELLHHVVWFMLIPSLSTYLIIWWAPKLTYLAHIKHIKYYFGRKGVYDTEKVAYERVRVKTEREIQRSLAELAKIKTEQATSNREIARSRSQEEIWDDEYLEFQASKFRGSFGSMVNAIYKNDGYFPDSVETSVVAYYHALGLISVAGNRASFTEKGRYFARKDLERK